MLLAECTMDDDDVTQQEACDSIAAQQKQNLDCCNVLRSVSAGVVQQTNVCSPRSTAQCSSVRGLDTAAVQELSAITCRLEPSDLWNRFHELGTEMIITKSGRFALLISALTHI
jgi:T-box